MRFNEYVEQAQIFFEKLVETATDDELFAGSYIQGHFDVAVGSAQVAQEILTVSDLNDKVEKSLVKAYRSGELNDEDKQHVVDVWEKLKSLTE